MEELQSIVDDFTKLDASEASVRVEGIAQKISYLWFPQMFRPMLF